MARTGETFRRSWVTRVVEEASDRTLGRPLVVACLTLGLVPVVLTALFFALAGGDLPTRFVTAHLLAAFVPVVGPAAIYYWEVAVYPRFVSDTADLAVNPAAVRRVAANYKETFARRYPLFAVPWTVLIVGVIGVNASFFESIGVGGPGDPAFWAYLVFAAWWGLITGIGFHGAITAIRAIRAVGDLELEIDPLHPDGLGGLSSVGHLAIWTTMLISVGSLTLPLAFILGTEGGYAILVYGAVGLYVVVIAASFVYPTVYVNRRAQEIRERELEDRRAKIRRLQAQANDLESAGGGDQGATMNEMAKRLEIQRLRDEFNEYDSVNLYPLSIGIITRLVSSILLPVFFILFETFLKQFL